MHNCLKTKLLALLLAAGLSSVTSATIVQFQTVLGDFEVNLFDNITPETVANFLEYVESEAYTDTFIHRSIPTFIVQGGGYTHDADRDPKIKSIPANPPVINEPHLSNQRGTIAMAKLGNNPHSATMQWFFNLSDNSANLDRQNGGFTVFGQVIGDGMEIVDAIAALPRFNMGSPFNELPLRNYGQDELDAETPVSHEHLVLITGIVIIDADPDTGNALNPMPTTRGRSSGGSIGAVLLLVLGFLALVRRER
jgi:peptidyl-prolyl cis-trans isomerase A (cyclophilin A)